MSDIIDEIDALHAKATPGDWFYVASMTDEEAMRPGGAYADVVVANEDEDSSPTSVLDGPSDKDAELIASLKNNWPALSARLREAERKAEAFDAIANGNVVFEFDPGFRKYAARTNASCNFWSVDLLTAIESVLRGQKDAHAT